MEWQGEEPVFVGVHKVDMQCEDEEAANAGIILYGSNAVGGEAFFVPRHQHLVECDGEHHIKLYIMCLMWWIMLNLSSVVTCYMTVMEDLLQVTQN